MTPAELITLINNEIVTNGNNEITANVLNPVLVAMVNQINDLVGNETNLPPGSDTVIEAINNIPTTGITIHTGEDNPNDIPPVSFELGDFYSQTNVSAVIIAFWQYNGIEWVEVLSRHQQKLRNIIEVVSNYTIETNDDLIIYDGNDSGDLITIPDATVLSGKIFTLVNISAVSISTSNYTDLNNSGTTLFKNNSVLKVISNGVFWQQINNE